MKIDIVTLFPEMFTNVFAASILGKAREQGIVQLNTVDFRDYADNKHRTVDDYPYGGGAGMVLQPGPIFAAVGALLPEEGASKRSPRIIMLSPQGEVFSQQKAHELADEEHLILLCGHYEGFDERIREHLVTDELSIGDYVLTGGEIPAMVIMDSVVRLLPGVLGNEQSALADSFSTGGDMPLLEHPHYTRPEEFRGWRVPDVLLSGHHANIHKWRHQQSLLRTWQRRPELIDDDKLTDEERSWLEEHGYGK